MPACTTSAGSRSSNFFVYDLFGGALWIFSLALLVYWFGKLPWIKHKLTLVIIVIVAISLLPALFGWLRHRRR